MKTENKIAAIALAIALKEGKDKMSQENFIEGLKQLNEYQLFSIRQIAKITGKSSSTLNRMLEKKSKTGGRLNPEHLTKLRALIFQKGVNEIDYHMVSKMVKEGTSADVIQKITGIPRSTINRKNRAFTSSLS